MAIRKKGRVDDIIVLEDHSKLSKSASKEQKEHVKKRADSFVKMDKPLHISHK